MSFKLEINNKMMSDIKMIFLKLFQIKSVVLVLTFIIFEFTSNAQIFEIRKLYTGSHFAFTRINPVELNRFVVDFNRIWGDDISKGFHQYTGGEFGQTFTTNGTRFVFGKREDFKWTFSTEYAFGRGKDKNVVEFKNGISQVFNIFASSNQINTSFGITLKENKFWLEGLYCTNLKKLILEYATIHINDVESYGTEYQLNGLYRGELKTMEFGVQTSYKYKKAVFYARALLPVIVLGPNKENRKFIDERSSQLDQSGFPSHYEDFIQEHVKYLAEDGQLGTQNFKGFSYGFGMFYLIGKEK